MLKVSSIKNWGIVFIENKMESKCEMDKSKKNPFDFPSSLITDALRRGNNKQRE